MSGLLVSEAVDSQNSIRTNSVVHLALYLPTDLHSPGSTEAYRGYLSFSTGVRSLPGRPILGGGAGTDCVNTGS